MLLSGLGAIANGAATEPAQAIAGQDHVKAVAPARRQDAEEAGERPWRAEPLRHADRSLRFEPGQTFGDEDVGLEFVGIEPVMAVEGAPHRRLRWEQTEHLAPIMAQDQAGPSRAERAVTVED